MIVLTGFIGEARPSWRSNVQTLSDAIGRACLSAQLSHKATAYYLHLDPSHWSKQLLHDGPNLSRLLLLPKVWWAAFLPLLAVLSGCDHLLASKGVDAVSASEMATLRAEVAALRAEVSSLAARRTA